MGAQLCRRYCNRPRQDGDALDDPLLNQTADAGQSKPKEDHLLDTFERIGLSRTEPVPSSPPKPALPQPNPGIVSFASGGAVPSDSALDGWYLAAVRSQSGVPDLPERVEVICFRLFRRSGEKICQYEARVCLHDPVSTFTERDADIFGCQTMAGSWRLRMVEEPSIFFRLQGEPGVSLVQGPSYKTVLLKDLADAAWISSDRLPRELIEAHWRRWGLASQ
eukprot:TRINITY_DN37026_c0_g1_i2.p1 TRINITY_DN37026_c0_g1~~TRINITY_DN37026_c0_g1_i2.p1  ORF type:complete len:221 (-),score=42.49 TRINITY_DN37026_c0_g1_i2:236-898(-)